MRKRVKMLFAAALCAVTMAIVGCGGGNASQTTTNEAAQESYSTEQFLGEWKLAYIQSGGVTVAGNLGGLSEISGDDMSITLTINDDGTAKFAIGEESADMKWESASKDKITITSTGASESEDSVPESAEVTYNDGELLFKSSDEPAADAEEDTSVLGAIDTGVLGFTHDGTSAKVSIPSLDDSKPITSADDLVGDWKLSAVCIFGVYITGEPANLSAFYGESSSSLEFKDDGTCTYVGNDDDYTVSKDGAVIKEWRSGATVPVASLGDNEIVLNLSESMKEMLNSDASETPEAELASYIVYKRAE